MLVLRWRLDSNGNLTATYSHVPQRMRPPFLRDDAPQQAPKPRTSTSRPLARVGIIAKFVAAFTLFTRPRRLETE